MFRRSLLPVVRPRPSDAPGLFYDEGIEEDGIILSGTTRVPATGETYPVKNGYLDLLKGRLGGGNGGDRNNAPPPPPRRGPPPPATPPPPPRPKGRLGGDNVANLTNSLPGAGRGYEPLWR